ALTLYAVTRPRVRAIVVGRYADGWIGQAARYDRFAGHARGTLTVTFSRGTWCGPATTPATLRIRVMRLRGGTVPGPTLAGATRNLQPCGQRSVTLPTPAGPFRASVAAGATFVPGRVQPGSYDFRQLGALVGFSYR